MLMKRIYDRSDPEKPKLSHIELRHTGTHAEQNFSRRLVEAAAAEGWVTISRGKLILHAKPEDLNYTILRSPGTYCCHCGEKLSSDPAGVEARAHIAAKHKGVDSPDAANPAGYRVTHAYECALDTAQHAKFKAKRLGAAPAPART